MSVEELAKGIKYSEVIRTSWKPPRYVLARPEEKNELIRKRWNIQVEGLLSRLYECILLYNYLH